MQYAILQSNSPATCGACHCMRLFKRYMCHLCMSKGTSEPLTCVSLASHLCFLAPLLVPFYVEFWRGLTRNNADFLFDGTKTCRGVPLCAPETTRTKTVMIKRAHTEFFLRFAMKAAARHPKGWRLLPKGRKKAERRPYTLIVPVVFNPPIHSGRVGDRFTYTPLSLVAPS